MSPERRAYLISLARGAATGPLIPVVVAVVLGLFEIGDKSLWLDEGYSVSAALLPTPTLARLLLFDELHGSPYHLSLHPWTWLGTSEALLRLLSVVYGAIAVFATYFVGKRYGVGFPAALILAVAPFFVQYEQEVRVYTMLIAASAVSTLLFLRLLEAPGRVRALLYAASAALMIYLQPLGALVIVAHGAWLMVTVAPPLKWRLASVYVPVVIAWIPMFWFAATIGRRKISFIRPTDLDFIVFSSVEVAGGAVMLGAVLAMLAVGMRRDLPALWLFVPIVGTLAITFLIQPVLQPRYMIAILPAAAIILARNRRLSIAALVALSLVGVGQWYTSDTKDDWRGAGAWVTADAQPNDGIVFAPTYLRVAFSYYSRAGEPLHVAVPWSGPNIGGGPSDIPGILARQRIWLVEGYGRELPDDVAAALAQFQVVETRDFGGNGVWVSLLQRNPLTLVGEP